MFLKITERYLSFQKITSILNSIVLHIFQIKHMFPIQKELVIHLGLSHPYFLELNNFFTVGNCQITVQRYHTSH